MTTIPITLDSKKPIQKQELIGANINLLIEQLRRGTPMHCPATSQRWAAFNYSFGNILEIARQRPDDTRVAGFYGWKQLGRSVKQGQKGIRILAPIVGIRRKKDENT